MINSKVIFLDNIKCGGCANSIQKIILEIIGISKAEVNVEEGSVSIDYDQYDEVALEDKLTKMGYPPQGTSSTGQKIKSYVSCAVGKVNL